MKSNKFTGSLCILIAIIITIVTGTHFKKLSVLPEVKSGPGVTKIIKLSDYFYDIHDTAGDTPIYVMKGEKPGGKVLILGGTHPNEPSGHLAAITFIQNVRVKKGTVFVLPYTNRSGFTHNDSQEGSPYEMHFKTKKGEDITFRYGSRATNPIHQWPDPDVYIHATSGQKLSGSEMRNINRAYPGKENGTFTEKVAFAITSLVKKEKIDLTFDLHEASPEYPVINATVSHEKGMNVAAPGIMALQLNDIDMSLEPSPKNLHGLTHRELGDFTDTIPILMETVNASQGRLRGTTNENLVLTGKDKFYVKANDLNMTYVPYDDKGHPIEERVGRHLQGIIEFTKSYNTNYPENNIIFEGCPTYNELFSDVEEKDLGGKKLGEYFVK